MMADGLPTGVPPLDRMLPPAPDGASILLVNEPGVEADGFLYQIADAHAGQDREVVYVTTTRAPGSVTTAMDEHGFSPSDRVVFVDIFSPLLGAASEGAYTVQDPSDLKQIFQVIEDAAHEHPDAILILDSLSGLADNTTPEDVVEALPLLEDALDLFDLSICLFTDWPYGVSNAQVGAGFDAVIRLGALEERVTFGQYFEIERADWAHDLHARRHPYKIYKPGGVHVYIPKIVVTGPYNAGKSTFVHSISDTAVSVDRLGTTVALDHGHVTANGVTADIFGTPGQVRFDPILRTVAGQALGVILLVDASKPETLDRARELLEKTVTAAIPVIVAANKQDAPGALSPEEVRRRLDPPPHVKVLGCIGRDRESALEVLETMNESIVLRRSAEDRPGAEA